MTTKTSLCGIIWNMDTSKLEVGKYYQGKNSLSRDVIHIANIVPIQSDSDHTMVHFRKISPYLLSLRDDYILQDIAHEITGDDLRRLRFDKVSEWRLFRITVIESLTVDEVTKLARNYGLIP